MGFSVDHHIAATAHFKGCHDGNGGVENNAVSNAERCGIRIASAITIDVVAFLKPHSAKLEDGDVPSCTSRRGFRIASGVWMSGLSGRAKSILALRGGANIFRAVDRHLGHSIVVSLHGRNI